MLPLFAIIYAQEAKQLHGISGIVTRKHDGLNNGDTLKLLQLKTDKDESQAIFSKSNGKYTVMPLKNANKSVRLIPDNPNKFWTTEYFNNGMYSYYARKGYHNPIRKETIDEANEYVEQLRSSFYSDEFVTDYVKAIFLTIAPKDIDDKRIGTLKAEILNSPNPDAYMLPNGTLLITTGLLSVLDSEEELKAIIASELAHYVMDDQVMNILKERARGQRAELWGIVLNVAAITTEVILTENSEHYVPGGILLTTAVVSEIISEDAIYKMGMGYTNKQCYAADDMALGYLTINGYNTGALHSALQKIYHYYLAEKDDYALSRSGGYGNIQERIARCPEPEKDMATRSYQRMTSTVTSFNALIQYEEGKYESSAFFCQKNIATGNACDDDYLLLVKGNMNCSNTPEDNLKNLELIKKAKRIGQTNNLAVYKQEILLLMRMDEKEKAAHGLNEYIELLEDFKTNLTRDEDYNWVNNELYWSNSLYSKLSF